MELRTPCVKNGPAQMGKGELGNGMSDRQKLAGQEWETGGQKQSNTGANGMDIHIFREANVTSSSEVTSKWSHQCIYCRNCQLTLHAASVKAITLGTTDSATNTTALPGSTRRPFPLCN